MSPARGGGKRPTMMWSADPKRPESNIMSRGGERGSERRILIRTGVSIDDHLHLGLVEQPSFDVELLPSWSLDRHLDRGPPFQLGQIGVYIRYRGDVAFLFIARHRRIYL